MTRRSRNGRTRGSRFKFAIDLLDGKGRWSQQCGRDDLNDAKEYIKQVALVLPGPSQWRVRHGSRVVYEYSHSHKHEFSKLWTHYGEHGDQNVHVHPCVAGDGSCTHVLEATGRECDGVRESHHEVDLD